MSPSTIETSTPTQTHLPPLHLLAHHPTPQTRHRQPSRPDLQPIRERHSDPHPVNPSPRSPLTFLQNPHGRKREPSVNSTFAAAAERSAGSDTSTATTISEPLERPGSIHFFRERCQSKSPHPFCIDKSLPIHYPPSSPSISGHLSRQESKSCTHKGYGGRRGGTCTP